MKLDRRINNGAVGFVLKSAQKRRRDAKATIALFVKADRANNLELVSFKEAVR